MPELKSEDNSARILAARLREAIVSGDWAAGMKLPSTRDLALRHGMSKKTVARVLGRLEREGLINRAPRKRAVVCGRGPTGRRIVTLVTPANRLLSQTEPNWLGQVLLAADEALLAEGFHPARTALDIGALDSDDQLAAQLDRLVQDDLGGMLFTGDGAEAERIATMLDQRKVPWVSLRPITARTPYNYVTLDFFDACRAMGELFARSGRRRLLFMGVVETRMQMDMVAGFEYGVIRGGGRREDVTFWPCEGLDEAAGYARMCDYCREHDMPDGVFAGGDFLALGVIRACREFGAAVPDRVGVAGATGYEMTAFTDPPLTIIRQPMRELGREVARQLLACTHNQLHRVMGVHLIADVIVRDSLRVDPQIVEQVNASGATAAMCRTADDAVQT